MGAMKAIYAPVIVTGLLLAIGTAAPAAEYQIVVANMKFAPPPDQLHLGDVIIWRNDDIFHHTATARDASFDIDLPAKSEARMTIEYVGAVEFYCRFHPTMTGKLNVQP
jgi:plastocyanin